MPALAWYKIQERVRGKIETIYVKLTEDEANLIKDEDSEVLIELAAEPVGLDGFRPIYMPEKAFQNIIGLDLA
jgi:hypothetical protein